MTPVTSGFRHPCLNGDGDKGSAVRAEDTRNGWGHDSQELVIIDLGFLSTIVKGFRRSDYCDGAAPERTPGDSLKAFGRASSSSNRAGTRCMDKGLWPWRC